MKKLKLLILCLLSIFCLNSCFTVSSFVMDYGLAKSSNNLFRERVEDISLNNKIKVKIPETNKYIYIPEGYELIEYNEKIQKKYDDKFPHLFGSISLTFLTPEYILYNKKTKSSFPLGIRKNYKVSNVTENLNELIKLKENTYMVKARKGYGDAFLKQISDNILVYSVFSSAMAVTEKQNEEMLKAYLELTKDW